VKVVITEAEGHPASIAL